MHSPISQFELCGPDEVLVCQPDFPLDDVENLLDARLGGEDLDQLALVVKQVLVEVPLWLDM